MRTGSILAGIVVSIVLLSGFSLANATDFSKLPKNKQSKSGLYLTVNQAYELMKKEGQKTLFLDVRTRPEVNFLGTPKIVDANVPYMQLNEWFAWNSKKSDFKMEVNSDFADEVAKRVAEKGLNKNSKILLICRSGTRSPRAADLLEKLGYTQVYSVVEGFEGDKAKEGKLKGQRVVNGWKNTGLPWTYKLDKAKMYKVGS